MSWRNLSFTDVIRIMQAVADVAPEKAGKVGAVLARGAGQRARMRTEHAKAEHPPEFSNPGPSTDEARVLEEVLDAIRAALVARWGEDYTNDLVSRVRS